MLLLGADLALYADWRDRKKLVGQLRSMDGFEAAQFEVGVQAGLVRAGLTPHAEPGPNKAAKSPDFVVPTASMIVALELKTLRAPQAEANRHLIEQAINHLIRTLPYSWNKDIVLQLSEATVASLDVQTQRFEKDVLPRIEGALRASFDRVHHEERLDIAGVGELIVSAAPAWTDDSYAGGFGVQPDDHDPELLLGRALSRAHEAADQLGAVQADLRIFVVWGGRHSLPAVPAAAAAQARILAEREFWRSRALDWIVFFNGHTLGPGGRWTIDTGVCRVSENPPAIPPAVLAGITGWGEGRAQ